MKTGRRRSSDRQIFTVLLVLIFCSMLLLNRHTPLMMDDYDYSFSWASGGRLSGVGDIFASQAAHYRIWGGRSVTHFLAQLFLFLGKPVFNVANAAMYVCLLLEIYALACRKERRWDYLILMASHGLLLLLVPFFGVAFLWLDGACNYLWGTALALVPVLIAKSEREGGIFDTDGIRGYLAAPLCLIGGWTNENTGCGVLAALVMLIVYDLYRGRRVRPWRLVCLLFQAAGVALMLLAPGNFARASAAEERALVMELVYRFAVTTYCLLRYAGIYMLVSAVGLILAMKKHVPLRWERFALVSAAALLAAYALVGSPQISDRSFTAVIVLTIALVMGIAADIRSAGIVERKASAKEGYAALVIAAALLGSVTGGAIRDVIAHERAWQAQEMAIRAAIEEGKGNVQIAGVPSGSRFTMHIALEKDASSWPNSTLSKYYGISIFGE